VVSECDKGQGRAGGGHSSGFSLVRLCVCAGSRSFVGDMAGGCCPLCHQRATKGGWADGTHLGSTHLGCDACSASLSSMAVAVVGSRQQAAGGDMVGGGGGGKKSQ